MVDALKEMSEANYDTPLLSLSEKVEVTREERREMCEGAHVEDDDRGLEVQLCLWRPRGTRHGACRNMGDFWTAVRRVELDRLNIGAWFRCIDVGVVQVVIISETLASCFQRVWLDFKIARSYLEERRQCFPALSVQCGMHRKMPDLEFICDCQRGEAEHLSQQRIERIDIETY
ncbi:hypothetical protein BDN67DRAFT_1042935 [Paxillus ammoniavirescens]|nr:hypothetical protein BDN67DRAFT_1042935 [Paxillus ammoniavirescens]